MAQFMPTRTGRGPSNSGPFVPTLGDLSLSGQLQIGVATSGIIIGATSGSTITGNIPGITINGAARTYSGTPTGSAQVIAGALVETLAGATFSPRLNSVTVLAATATPALTLSGPLSYAADAAAGVTVATISNVPAGVTPTISPADGRMVIGGDATVGWKVVKGMTASAAGSIAITVAATGATSATATVTVTSAASQTPRSLASAGWSLPRDQTVNAVTANEVYAFWGKWFYVTEALPSGEFTFSNYHNSGLNQDALSPNPFDQTILKCEILTGGPGGTIIPVINPANGNPIVDGNPAVVPAGGNLKVTHGPLAVGLYYLDTHDQMAVGSKRLYFHNNEIANYPGEVFRVASTSAHTSTTRPTGTTSFYSGPCPTIHTAPGRRKSVVVFGDSNEDRDNQLNGAYAEGPIRSMLQNPNVGGGRVITFGAVRFASSHNAVYGTGTAPKMSILDWFEMIGSAVGYTEKWLFTDAISEHFRNGIGAAITGQQAIGNRLKAKDPTVRFWGASPVVYVKGTAGVGSGNQTVPADLYTTVENQVPIDPEGTTNRDDYITWGKGGGGGLMAGWFDHDVDERPASPYQRVFNIGPAGTLGQATVDDASTGPQVIKLSFKPLQGEFLVIEPGATNAEPVTVHNLIAPIDNGDGTWNVRLFGSTRVQKAHPLNAVVKTRLTVDATHGGVRFEKLRRESPTAIATKALLVAA